MPAARQGQGELGQGIRGPGGSWTEDQGCARGGGQLPGMAPKWFRLELPGSMGTALGLAGRTGLVVCAGGAGSSPALAWLPAWCTGTTVFCLKCRQARPAAHVSGAKPSEPRAPRRSYSKTSSLNICPFEDIPPVARAPPWAMCSPL